MNLRIALGLGALLLTFPAGAKPVYKCEENGKITYTDQPCSPDARPHELPAAIVVTPPVRSQQELARQHDARLARDRAERDRADAEWLKQHGNRRDREQRVRKAILEHKVIKGMTADEVRQSLGEPENVVTSENYGTPKESWTYLENGEARTVNFKNREVISTSLRRKSRR